MLLSKIIDEILYESGQFIISDGSNDLHNLKLDMHRVWQMFKHEIYNYTRYVPLIKIFNVNITPSFTYSFLNDPNNTGFIYPTASPTSAIYGTAGSTEYAYVVAAIDPRGKVISVTNTCTVTTGNATLNGSNYITLTWEAITGAASYNVYRYLTNGTPSTIGLIGSPPGTTINDTGLAGDGTNPPQTNGIPPIDVLRVVPVGTLTVISALAYFMSPMIREVNSSNRLLDPRQYLWSYDKAAAMLYRSEIGWFDCTTANYYDITEIYGDSQDVNKLTDVNIAMIEQGSEYYVLKQILLGRFLQAVGRSRRAFSFSELPIKVDADLLVSEGDTIYREAVKLLYSRSDWSGAIRP